MKIEWRSAEEVKCAPLMLRVSERRWNPNISTPVITDATVVSGIRMRFRIHTFEEVGSEPGFVDRAIGYKLHPQLVGAALDVVRLVVSAEAAQKRAAFWIPIAHLEVVISTAVVPLNLRKGEGKKLNDIKGEKPDGAYYLNYIQTHFLYASYNANFKRRLCSTLDKASEYEQPVLVNWGSSGALSLFAPAGWKRDQNLKRTPRRSAGTEEWNQWDEAWRWSRKQTKSDA